MEKLFSFVWGHPVVNLMAIFGLAVIVYALPPVIAVIVVAKGLFWINFATSQTECEQFREKQSYLEKYDVYEQNNP